MSLNLYFELDDTSSFIEFPFQTPTDFTMDMINEPDTEKRIAMVENLVREWDWTEDEIEETVTECRQLLEHPSLTLCFM